MRLGLEPVHNQSIYLNYYTITVVKTSQFFPGESISQCPDLPDDYSYTPYP